MNGKCFTCSHFKPTYDGCGECNIEKKLKNQEKSDGKPQGVYGIDEPCPLWNKR